MGNMRERIVMAAIIYGGGMLMCLHGAMSGEYSTGERIAYLIGTVIYAVLAWPGNGRGE